MDRPDQIEAQTIYARRKWSAERLEIPLNASKQEARKQWLKSLEEADFLPDEVCLPAWRIVSSAESAAEARQRFPEWASQFDDAIGREIEEYAQRFFTLEPDERRKEFTRLFNASRDNPRQQKRISSLAPGLKLPKVAGNEQADKDDDDKDIVLADVEELSQHLRSMFVATPPVRARLHQKFLREHASELSRWAGAAKALSDLQSPLVVLVPEQWEDLTSWEAQTHQMVAFKGISEDQTDIAAIETLRQEISTEKNSNSIWLVFFNNNFAEVGTLSVLILVVVVIIAIIHTATSSSKKNPPWPAKKVTSKQPTLRFHTEENEKREYQKWIRMEEKQFQDANGDEIISSMGLENKRREYWAWRKKVDQCEQTLKNLNERLTNVLAELRNQKSLELEWKVENQSKLDAWEQSPPLSKSQIDEQLSLKRELNEILAKKIQLISDIQSVHDEIRKREFEQDRLNIEDPSNYPFR